MKSLLALCFLALASCTSVQFAPSMMNHTYLQRTPPDAIELYRSSAPATKYIEIGAVTSCCSTSTNGMIDLLRKKASEQGGDALMDLEINAQGGASATVIRYE